MTSNELAVRSAGTLVRRRSRPSDLTIEDAELIFLNFAGEAKQYNIEGDRNFCVVLDDESAQQLIELGWNVKTREARDEGDSPRHILKVAVKFGDFPPELYMLTSKNKTLVPEEMLGLLDKAEVERVDITIKPYAWSVNGNTGIKAYLKRLYMKIEENYLDLKYENWGSEGELEIASEAVEAVEIETPEGVIPGEIVESWYTPDDD